VDLNLWQGPKWSVSPHNFAEGLARPTHKPELHDVTLRDGEECADVVYTTADKVRIAEALALAGVKRYELFVTVPGWYEAVKQLMARKLPMDLYVTWHPGRTERVIELGARHVMVWYRASDVYQRVVVGKPRQAVLDDALAGVRRVRELGAVVVNFFMPESTRMELDQLRDTVLAAKEAGADAVTLVDSLAICRPAAMGFLVGMVREWSGLPVDVHCHNDFGLAVANVLAAYEAGAVGLNCSVNALGYRAGNAALEEVAVGLRVLYGVDAGIQLDRLPALSRLVAEITGIEPGYFKAVTGRGAFRYEQWGATAKLEASGERPSAFAYEPELVGLTPHLHIGKWSDAGGVERRLRELGLEPSAEQVARVLDDATRLSVAKGRPLGDDELLALAREVRE
jgi:isopropylmalate/homocitrate/citramalate synthase